jgi:hypothetical protein
VSRKHWIWAAVIVVILGGAGAVAWSLRGELAYAQIATGYAAKQTCSCLYVSNRTMDSCMSEYTPDQQRNFTVEENGDRVRASVLFGAISAEARFEDGYGCALLD